jgi:S1-C subfamily serine protease
MFVTGGEEQSITIATVVSKREFAGYWEYLIQDAIFTAPARFDHSGAALINSEGELVGIGSLFVLDALTPGERLPGNMFVPVDLLRPVLEELVRTGKQSGGRRPWLGLNSLEEDGRVKIIQVNEDSPAAQAGLAAGDIILSLDGQPVESLRQFYQALWARGPAGVQVSLRVLHGPNVRDVTITSIDRADFMKKRPMV